MFVALHRWVAVAILGGAFVAGAMGGFVLRAATAKGEGAACQGRDADPASRSAVPLSVSAGAPQAQPIVVKVIAEAARPVPGPFRPEAKPSAKAAAKSAALTERPDAPGVPETKAEPTPGHFYKVQAGDTLHDLAIRAYGGVKRLGDLIHANSALDPERIRIGALVYVPAGTEAAPAGPGEPAAKAPAPAKAKEAVPATAVPAAPPTAPPAPAPVTEEAVVPRKGG